MTLVKINNGSHVTTTLAISEGLEVEHKAIIQLVRKHQADLEEFGRVAFEMAPFETSGGMQTRVIAELNERQATLVLTYSKNTEIARTFKKRLVKTFYELAAKQLPVAPTPALQLAEAVLLAGRMIEEQKFQIEQRDKLIAIAAPKAAIADRISIADGLFGFRQVAKMLQMNENKFKQYLMANDWIYYLGKRMTVKSYYLKNGFAETKIKLIQLTDGEERAVVDMYFTSKGVHSLAAKICPHDFNEEVE